jgi:hypothetical protein
MRAYSTGSNYIIRSGTLSCLTLCSLLGISAVPARSQHPPIHQNGESASTIPQQTTASPAQPSNSQSAQTPRENSSAQQFASIRGKVIDQSGAAILGAKITLSRGDQSISQEVLTDSDGVFAFADLPPGPFHLAISSPGLTPQTFDDTLQNGQAYALPLVMLSVAAQVTEVRVSLTPEQLATMEVKDEEKLRVLGVIPNYFVSFLPNPEPMSHKLKFQLARKSASDPFTVGSVGVLAGIEQATNKWKEYGQGARGYAKRYGASYADVAVGTFVSNAVLPSLFKQDPRYYYAGPSHSKRSRFLRALGGAFIAKSDSGNWEPNYSNLVGGAAAGAVSNLYYPARNRGAGLVLSTMLIRLGEITAANFFQEFLGPKFTSHVPARPADQP